MKIAPVKVGGNRKQIMILGGLALVLIVVWIINSTDSTPKAATTPTATTGTPVPLRPVGTTPALPQRGTPQPPMPQRRSATANRGGSGRVVEDFHPTLKLKEGADLTAIDPTIKLALLAKVKNVAMEGGTRSLFDFGAAPPPPIDVAAIKPKPELVGPKWIPPPPPPGPKVAPPPPPPTPIPFKYYGYATPPRSGPRKAFFIEGEDIHIAGENDMIKNRYKIIRIGVNSAVVEDTTDKHQQTLPLEEEKNNA
jgi:hypothetical protein